MLFNTVSFLYGFLPVTYVVFWKLKTRRQRQLWLTVTGYAFYSFWDYRFCGLMAFSTVVSYLAGVAMLRWDSSDRKRWLCLVVPIAIDLGLLGFFKYTGMALDTARIVAERLNVAASIPYLEIALPIGISFYTFHTISYIVDAYRRTIRPTSDFFEFSCYVSLFCQLVAGPIVRFRQIEGDLDRIGVTERVALWNRGWSFLIIGMMKKVLLADSIACVIDPALADYGQLSTAMAWAVMAGYTYQLYFDFSGYSDMAVGLGCLFGLRIPQNFDSPYQARNPAKFWRKWHMSLATCMRDYLYIPLGGNRHHVYRNLLVTMVISGLWHGANWTFVAWGAYHGILLITYRRCQSIWDRLPLSVQRSGMFLSVLIGWVFFRSTSFEMAGELLRRMFSWHAGPAVDGTLTLVVLLTICTLIVQLAPNTWQLRHEWKPRAAVALSFGFACSLIAMYTVNVTPFLYFQF